MIQAELLATLQGEGPFTLFAPTDQAFADAGIDLASLDTPEGKVALTDILLHHVYSGAVLSADITDGMVVQMVNGDNITLTVTTGMSASVLIGNATVTGADVMTSNGIIHVIDKVLMPPVEDVTDTTDTTDTTGQTDGASGDSDDEGGYLWILIVVILLLGGGAGGLLFMRSRGGDDDDSKEFGQGGLVNQLQPITTTAYAGSQATATTAYATQPVEQAQQYQSVQQTQQYQPAQQVAQVAPVTQVAQVQPVQTVEVIPQPAVAEPTVLRQWTDEAGYTWRAMDDGNTYWWTGTEWQKYS